MRKCGLFQQIRTRSGREKCITKGGNYLQMYALLGKSQIVNIFTW